MRPNGTNSSLNIKPNILPKPQNLCAAWIKKLPENFDAYVQAALKEVCAKAETIATRKASQNSIEILAKELPELVGGSADLTPSNLTDWSNSVSVTREHGGNYIHYGVREFGMGAS